jgi:hypothetical protein
MIDFESHKNKLEGALSVRSPLTNKNCIDEIDEKLWWENVIPALNQISIEAADELQEETGGFYPKDTWREDANGNIIVYKSFDELQKAMGKLDPDVLPLSIPDGFIGFRRKLKYSQAPPTRSLSMTLVLCYFLGFLDASGDHEMHKGAVGARERIINAYERGLASHPKSRQPNEAKTEETS